MAWEEFPSHSREYLWLPCKFPQHFHSYIIFGLLLPLATTITTILLVFWEEILLSYLQGTYFILHCLKWSTASPAKPLQPQAPLLLFTAWTPDLQTSELERVHGMLTEKGLRSPYSRRDSQDLEKFKNLPKGISLTSSRVRGTTRHFYVDFPLAQFQSHGRDTVIIH